MGLIDSIVKLKKKKTRRKTRNSAREIIPNISLILIIINCLSFTTKYLYKKQRYFSFLLFLFFIFKIFTFIFFHVSCPSPYNKYVNPQLNMRESSIKNERKIMLNKKLYKK